MASGEPQEARMEAQSAEVRRRHLTAELERARRLLDSTRREQFPASGEWKAALHARERQVRKLEEQLAKLGVVKDEPAGEAGEAKES
jgi:hypothetical protein